MKISSWFQILTRFFPDTILMLKSLSTIQALRLGNVEPGFQVLDISKESVCSCLALAENVRSTEATSFDLGNEKNSSSMPNT